MTERSFQSLIGGISLHDDSEINISLKASLENQNFNLNGQPHDGLVIPGKGLNIDSKTRTMIEHQDALSVCSGGSLNFAPVPINALAPGKINFPLADLENIPIFNTSDGGSLELQAFPGGTQALQGIQTVKLTLINCGDQQTILLTTPSAHFTMPDQNLDGVTLTLPDNLMSSELNLGNLTSMQLGDASTHTEKPDSNDHKLNYIKMTSLPPITSVSDKLYNQMSNDTDSVQPTHSYAIEDLKPVQRNGKINVDNSGKIILYLNMFRL